MPKKVKLKLKSAIKNSILKAPDIMLSKVTEPLNKDNYQRIVNSFLKRSMKHRKGAVGIAGNQIHMPYSIFIAQLVPNVWKLFINARILKTAKSSFTTSELVNGMEGCLSLPGSEHGVARRQKIEVIFRDIGWKPVMAQFEDFQARVVQHEIDHLNGILIDPNMEWRQE